MQTMALASHKGARQARQLADLYLNPPLAEFDFLAWDKMREIAAAGQRYATPLIAAWLREHPEYRVRASHWHDWLQLKVLTA